MKRILWVVLGLAICTAQAQSRDDERLLARAEATSARQMPQLAPSLQQWLRQEASRRAGPGRPLDEDSLQKAVTARLAGQDYTSKDIDGAAVLLLVLVVHEDDAGLKSLASEMQDRRARHNPQGRQVRDDAPETASRSPAGTHAAPDMQPASQAKGSVAAVHDAINAPVVVCTDPPCTMKGDMDGAMETAKDKLDSMGDMGDMGEMEPLRLQIEQQRAKAIDVLSKVMRKRHDVEQAFGLGLK